MHSQNPLLYRKPRQSTLCRIPMPTVILHQIRMGLGSKTGLDDHHQLGFLAICNCKQSQEYCYIRRCSGFAREGRVQSSVAMLLPLSAVTC